jgi:hypothetical protein
MGQISFRSVVAARCPLSTVIDACLPPALRDGNMEWVKQMLVCDNICGPSSFSLRIIFVYKKLYCICTY